jgi:hypothetical protein
MRTITIEKEVDIDVDLDDYFDEFMQDASDEDLIEEIEKRGHRVYKKGIPITPFGEQPVEFNNPTDLKRHLCDIANLGYCISNEELINEIKSKLP